MQNRWIALIVAALFVVFLGIVTALVFAPESSQIDLNENTENRRSCLTDTESNCLVMPGVSGFNINSSEIAFPEQFVAEYHLVVMPFDREQQVLAVTWLPLFKDLAAENDTLQFWSIAALPELNSAVRLLVLGGTSAAISDAEIRTQVTVLFLEEQEAFLEALDIDNIDVIQAFIMDRDGVVYYRDTGEYTLEKGEQFSEALQLLIDTP